MPKLKGDTAGPSFDPLQNEQIRPDAPSSKPVLPKNETPNRFWAFVEPYCAPIAQDDIKLLEDLIKGHSDMTEYYKVQWTFIRFRFSEKATKICAIFLLVLTCT